MATNNSIVRFHYNPFAEGRFVYVYIGTWRDNTSKKGQLCAIKKFKDFHAWKSSSWDTGVEIHHKAQRLATDFNHNLQFVEVQVLKSNETFCSIKKDEYILAEDYLDGDFRMWCNNSGYVAKEARNGVDNILTAFMHWTWIQTGGEEMVGNIQGVKTDRGEYKLTNPTIISTTNKYGPTDTGVEGMTMFFLTHMCSPECSGLAKPTVAQFVGKIPNDAIQSLIDFDLNSYQSEQHFKKFERKFPDDVRRVLVDLLVSTATGK